VTQRAKSFSVLLFSRFGGYADAQNNTALIGTRVAAAAEKKEIHYSQQSSERAGR
jgi:hypothetical protein